MSRLTFFVAAAFLSLHLGLATSPAVAGDSSPLQVTSMASLGQCPAPQYSTEIEAQLPPGPGDPAGDGVLWCSPADCQICNNNGYQCCSAASTCDCRPWSASCGGGSEEIF